MSTLLLTLTDIVTSSPISQEPEPTDIFAVSFAYVGSGTSKTAITAASSTAAAFFHFPVIFHLNHISLATPTTV